VDEVLAVGDASFQKKCLGKMESVASHGRTVLFVSHNMAAVSRLCRRAILLRQGKVVSDGPVSTVIKDYVGGTVGESPVEVDFEAQKRCPASADVRLLAARVRSNGMTDGMIDIRCPIHVDVHYEVLDERVPLMANVLVSNDASELVFISSNALEVGANKPRPPGRYRSTVTIPGNFMAEGLFSLDIAISTLDPHIQHCYERGLLAFHIHDPGEGDSARGTWAGSFPGAVRPIFPWSTERLGTVMKLSGDGSGE
jgi:lipopolysaccharide transport system ATP-binding protein